DLVALGGVPERELLAALGRNRELERLAERAAGDGRERLRDRPRPLAHGALVAVHPRLAMLLGLRLVLPLPELRAGRGEELDRRSVREPSEARGHELDRVELGPAGAARLEADPEERALLGDGRAQDGLERELLASGELDPDLGVRVR